MFTFEIDYCIKLKLIEKRHAELILCLVDSNRAYLRSWIPWVVSISKIDEAQRFVENCIR